MKGFSKIFFFVFGKQLESGQKKSKITLWEIQNEVVPCIVKVILREIRNILENIEITR